jgi:hypothetical protein
VGRSAREGMNEDHYRDKSESNVIPQSGHIQPPL